jgi:Flp pilus assembly protein TadG
MRRKKNISGRKDEQGIIIALVAVFMLAVVGAMAALSIDVVTMYTARSEAQLAADAAALAAARVLANSGATTDFPLMPTAQNHATNVAKRVAEQNEVGGTKLLAGDITVSFAGDDTDRTVTVSVKADLPTFFARIWGTKSVTVRASATAEAYNPSGRSALGKTNPVAPTCVKPWLLPNMDPTNAGAAIFDPASGAINGGSGLLGWNPSSPTALPMSLDPACPGGNCTPPLPAPTSPTSWWTYYPGDSSSFPAPTTSLPTCSLVPTPTPYQESIAGCVQTPISCNSTAKIDVNNYPNRNTETADAVNCLTHTTANKGDTVTTNPTPPPAAPFEFVAGDDNPVAVVDPTLSGKDVMVSDSLVTVPVFDVGTFSCTAAPCSAGIIGFVQLFLNPAGTATPPSGSVSTTVINIAGCGTGATGTPVFGNGASPVAVRLISP